MLKPEHNPESVFATEASSEATLHIADLLKHPDDLTNKFSAIRKKVAADRSAIDLQLRNSAESQLDDAKQGLDALELAGAETKKVKHNLENIDKFCSDAQTTINNYTKIKLISSTHQNFVSTRTMVEQFQQLNAQVDRVSALLSIDVKSILGPHDNMLFCHYQLFQLERFRNIAMDRAKSSTQDVMNTLRMYFRKIDDLTSEFEEYLWNVARNMVGLAKEDHLPAVLRMVKVIEREERADEENKKSEGIGVQNALPRQNKALRLAFFAVLREDIAKKLNDLYEKEKDDLFQLLLGFDRCVEDLVIILEDVAPCFPENYNIFKFFVLETHRTIYELFNKIVSKRMDGGAILQTLMWVAKYYEGMNGQLGVGEELLEPRLLNGREKELMADYVALVRGKLNEWINNLREEETKEFLKRAAPPEEANGMYLLSGTIILFQMYNQQIDLVASFSRGELLFSVVSECVSTMLGFQANWMKVMDVEFKKFESKSPDLAEGLPEYIMALANDCFRSTEFSEELCGRLKVILDEPWMGNAIEKVKMGSDGFIKVAKRAYTILIDFAVNDSQRALVLMHCQQWYEQDLMRMIIGTFEDYCEDYQAHLLDYLFSKLITDLLDRFTVCYIKTFQNKQAKFQMPLAAKKMKNDLAHAELFFSKYKPPKRVAAVLTDPIGKILSFIESSAEIAFVDFFALWNAYPDIPLSYVEDLLWRRDDLNKAEVKEIMEACRQKVGDDPRIANTHTIFQALGSSKK